MQADNGKIGATFLSSPNVCSKNIGIEVTYGAKTGVYDFTVSAKHGTLNPSAKIALTVSPSTSASLLESLQTQLEELKGKILNLR
jgi:hypothetical protein